MSASKAKDDAEQTIKILLGDTRDRIKLDDYVSDLLRNAINVMTADNFWSSLPGVNADGIAQRLNQYEQVMTNLIIAAILLGRWGQPESIPLFEKIMLRIAEGNKQRNSLHVWQAMRWYPSYILMYATGIAALSADNYPMVRALFRTSITSPTHPNGRESLITKVLDEMASINDAFKALPGHVRNRVPRSEYVHKLLQPVLEQLLYLGESYEKYFDEFEIISALIYADLSSERRGRIWAMPGRFGYKSQLNGSSIHAFVADNIGLGEKAPLITSGFFSSSPKRFQEVAEAYLQALANIAW